MGADPEVIFELVKRRAWRSNLWLKIAGTDTFRRLPDGQVALNENGPVAGWDDHALFAQRIRNYTAKPIEVEIRRSFGGHAVFRSGLGAKNHDYQTIQYVARVEARETAELKYELVTHQGRNAKQANLAIENAPRSGD